MGLTRRTSLARTGALTRGGRLPARSKRRAALYRTERIPLVKRLLEDDGPQRCQFPRGCTEQATTLHELLGRAQLGSLTDLANIRLSCVFHNGWAEDNPTEAEGIGWKIQRRHAAPRFPPGRPASLITEHPRLAAVEGWALSRYHTEECA